MTVEIRPTHQGPPAQLTMSRTAAAIAWIENGAAPGQPKRTAYQAAKMFGISQPAISQELARRRAVRSIIGPVVEAALANDQRPNWPPVPGDPAAGSPVAPEDQNLPR